MIQPGSLLMHVSVETDYKFPWWYFLHTGGIWQTNDTRSSEFAQSKVFLAPPLLFIVVLLTPSPQSSSAATTLVPLYTVVCSHSLNSSTRFSDSNIRNHTPRNHFSQELKTSTLTSGGCAGTVLPDAGNRFISEIRSIDCFHPIQEGAMSVSVVNEERTMQ